jgi:DNA-binding winged helix-turn-helix (wHTH) protein/TolB-like protein/Tfp pilus assembly protein PilF
MSEVPPAPRSASPPGPIYRFGPFQLDVAERRLARDGASVEITPKVFDLLVLLVEHRGRLLEKGQLLDALWPDSHVEESNLSVNVSALRKALGEGPDQRLFVETVPKRGYRFVAEVEALTTPAAEPLPPPGSPPSPAVAAAPRAPGADGARGSPRRRRLALAVAAGMVVLAGGALLWSSRPPRVRSLAVLPFKPLAESGGVDHLGVGMADALITRLSAIDEVIVRPTSATLRYADADPAAAGRELLVDAVLDGRVQRSDRSIRLTVQLTRVTDGRTLWAGTFDNPATDIFMVQDAVSERLAEALSIELTGDQRRRLTRRHTENTSAYELYLEGQYHALRYTADSASRAVELFRRAIALDSSFALPQAGLAAALITLATPGFTDQLQRDALAAAEQAIRLDPRLPEAHVSLGWVRMHAQWDWPLAEQSFRAALAIDPRQASAHGALSTLLTVLGRGVDGLAEMEQAIALDPTSATWRASHAWTLYCLRQYGRAVEESHRLILREPLWAPARRQQGRNLLALGRYPEAIDAFTRAQALSADAEPIDRVYLAMARAGVAGGAGGRAALLEALSPANTPSPYPLALVHLGLGDFDLAFEFLDHAYATRSGRMVSLKVDPELDPLRSDPRFAVLLRRMRFP